MRNEDYIVTQGWMYDIPLTDKQRTIYALIWGYSRDGRSCWRGTAKDLAEWAGCQERNAKYIVRQLEDRGLIAHNVVAWSNGVIGGTRSEFWAILPDNAAAPGKGNKGRINWTGKGKGVGQRIARGGRATDCPTPYTDSSSIYTSGGGGKNNARSRAKKTTTTTGFLFENTESGPEPGKTAIVELPFKEPYFREAWEALLRQPKWIGKSPEALQLTLDAFAAIDDPVVAAFCCRKAIENNWAKITDPAKIALDDNDQLLAFSDALLAREEGAAK